VPVVTTPFERALHLLLFVSAGVGFGVLAIALLERVSEGARRTVRLMHVVIAMSVFVAFFVAERIYHWVR
jgi:small neutral amino acid transporter SnatA (MarC family)